MIDFFFISSPLHLMIAANLAMQAPAHERVAIIISKDVKSRQRYAEIARACPQIFTEVVALPYHTRRFVRCTSSAAFRVLKRLFDRQIEARIFTGNDRRIEFQYAMHIVSRANLNIEGVYLDEGAVTYVGHKSMHSIQHRYIDPFFKRLFWGRWYKLAITTGSSDWIETVYAAFPDAVHPLLKQKKVLAIDPAPFKEKAFKDLAFVMLQGNREIAVALHGIKVIWTLPHEGAYLKDTKQYREIAGQLEMHINPSKIAIKPHPRITNQKIINDMFPGMLRLEHRIGMEALLPLLDSDCMVVGDISSTLLTTRWLRPDLQVVAIMQDQSLVGEAKHLYQDVLKIPVLAPHEVKSFLARING